MESHGEISGYCGTQKQNSCSSCIQTHDVSNNSLNKYMPLNSDIIHFMKILINYIMSFLLYRNEIAKFDAAMASKESLSRDGNLDDSFTLNKDTDFEDCPVKSKTKRKLKNGVESNKKR